ncbi:MAG: peptidase T [Thomasclavelia sp.]|nr:peptidase T [Thomasclavelia sp.]
MNIEERFLNYISIDTQSDPTSTSAPSKDNVFELGKVLVKEMKELGIQDAELNEYGIVYGTYPSNGGTGDIIGLIAHMDTAPDYSGKDIKPQKVNNYDGSVITVNKNLGLFLDPKEFPVLNRMIGHNLITTDGTTLLGCDDKGGIAIIMNAIQELNNNPSIKHNDIKIAFTPDEEVGRGVDNFDVKKFGAKYAYTLDGDIVDEFNYETFNAYEVIVKITGKSIHPGSAKGKLINAISVSNEFDNMLPVESRPEYTEGYEGFNHLHKITGDATFNTMEYIVRNHDFELIQKQLQDFKDITNYLNHKYGYEIVTLEIKEQYRNMAVEVTKYPQIIERLKNAIEAIGLKPKAEAIRGGTDGSRLSFMGLPTPNIGTGGGNFHGPLEFADITMMEQSTQVVINLVKE